VSDAARNSAGTGQAVAKGRPRKQRKPVSPARKRAKRLLDQSEWPLAGIALLFLAAYAWPILVPHLGKDWKHLCSAVVFGSWIIFIIDYVARVWVVRDRRSYFFKHIPDLLIVALPALRPMRLLRLVVLFRVINRKAAAALQGRVPLYVTVSAGTLVFCAALAVLDAERQLPYAKTNIHTFGDAIWWAVVTVTTVGYGDHFPVSTEGRFIAVGLMIGGVALIGVVTASFAAWFIDRVRAEEEDAEEANRRNLEQIMQQMMSLTNEVVALRAAAERAEQRELTPP
jgi:voltage-gated potassium channel